MASLGREPSAILLGQVRRRADRGPEGGRVYDWAFLDAEGNEVGRSGPFHDAEAAEEWMGAAWPDLASCGVEEVVLYDRVRGRRVYRMDLDAR